MTSVGDEIPQPEVPEPGLRLESAEAWTLGSSKAPTEQASLSHRCGEHRGGAG